MAFLIRELDGTMVEREPTVDKWYVGMIYDPTYPRGYRDDMIAQYIGNDEFYDEEDIDPTDMTYYDHLVEQA
jgi:hypothetical protein